MNHDQRNILTVSQLNRQSKELLETYLHQVQVSGEISNLARPASGHWYFTLKDSHAQIRCAMFRSRVQLLRFIPKEGDQVIVRGGLSLYEARGDYQLIANGMESAGEGALKLAFEQLKAKLYQEGLFAPEIKKPLPKHPKHLGVITSPTGAAIKDILSVLKRRFPNLPVSIYPTQVQGTAAAPQIADALFRANRDARCDVLIVSRGGGSLEDLWPFNEEAVARAIHASRIPVISAVGHEVDVAISDFVADLRAPTPSAAAELVSPDRMEWLGRFEALERSMLRTMQHKLTMAARHAQQLALRLKHPKRQLQENMQRLDMASMKLEMAMKSQLAQRAKDLTTAHHSLERHDPRVQLQALKQRHQALSRRLLPAILQSLSSAQKEVQKQASILQAVSPLATLARGYSITTNATENVITSTEDISPGDVLITRVNNGKIQSVVDSVEPLDHE